MSAPACRLRVNDPDLGTSWKCRGRGRKIVVVDAVAGELPIGPVCGPHFRSVRGAHGHLVLRVDIAPDVDTTDDASPDPADAGPDPTQLTLEVE